MSARKEHAELSSGTRPGGGTPSRRAATGRRPARAAAGFSFIEVLLATLIVGTLLIASSTAMSGASTAQHILAGEPTTAIALAREIHAAALTLPNEVGDGVPAADGSEVALLEDLDGAVFSPPIDALLDELGTAAGWSQSVEIETVDLASPGTLALDASSKATLVKLTVTVKQGTEVAGTFTWWLNP